jgi:spermidine synthase
MNSEKRRHVEALNPHFGYYFTIDKSLYSGATQYQKIELVNSPEFGHTLLLDEITQVVEKNEFQYHEPMVHPALANHPRPTDVLIIGGGDGGCLREVTRYPDIERIVFAELDEEVVKFSRQYLSSVNGGAFDDRRVECVFTDGRKYVETNQRQFDTVIMDMTDPFGPSRMLYTREFYSSVKQSFKDSNGIFVMHSESPVVRPVAFACINKTLQSVFTHVSILYVYIQMYATLWSISICSDSIDVAGLSKSDVAENLSRVQCTDLKLYTADTHHALFTAYPYIETILHNDVPIITDTDPSFPDNFI